MTLEQAQQIVMSTVRPPSSEKISLDEALGRVLAQDAVSDMDMPPFDVSTMDGFACRSGDRDRPLTIIETVAAGATPRKKVGPGQCCRIMTGARIPVGADMVVMFEKATEKDGIVTVTEAKGKPNLRLQGEDVHRGDRVLRKGTRIGAAETAVLASVGYASLRVFRRPRVGIIATGDEIVEPSRKPRNAQIRNSNGPQLSAQVRQAGCIPVYLGIVRDDPPAIDLILKKTLDECDVVLLSGGVSMGDFDFVPAVLKRNRVRLHFEKIAVKPGKPTVFGTRGRTCFFGLPGNPVSTFVIFEVLVRPLLHAIGGNQRLPPFVGGELVEEISRKRSDRLEFRPVRLDEGGRISAAPYHGSAHIHAYAGANGLIALAPGVERIAAGTMVRIQLLQG